MQANCWTSLLTVKSGGSPWSLDDVPAQLGRPVCHVRQGVARVRAALGYLQLESRCPETPSSAPWLSPSVDPVSPMLNLVQPSVPAWRPAFLFSLYQSSSGGRPIYLDRVTSLRGPTHSSGQSVPWPDQGPVDVLNQIVSSSTRLLDSVACGFTRIDGPSWSCFTQVCLSPKHAVHLGARERCGFFHILS